MAEPARSLAPRAAPSLASSVCTALERVVDLAALARGLATAVRVLVGFDAPSEDAAAVRVAQDPQAVGEAVGARLALAAAGLGLGRAEAAALALVALVGREGRAVGVRDQRQQLVEDHVLPPLALGWHLAAVGIRLVRQARLAPGAEAVAVVAQLPFGTDLYGLAKVAAVGRGLAQARAAAVLDAVLAVLVGLLRARLPRRFVIVLAAR